MKTLQLPHPPCVATLFLSFLLSLLPCPLLAQSLDECQELARQNYPLIRRYELIEQTSQYTLQNLNRGYLPQLSLSAQATLQSDVVSLPDALNDMMAAQGLTVRGLKKDQYKVALDLQQVLYDGGAISAQKEVSRRQADLQSAQNDVDLYQLRDRIDNLYFGILLTQEGIRQTDATLHLLNNNVERLQALCDEGVAMRCDVDQLRAEMLSTEQHRTDLQSTLVNLQQLLSTFCGKAITVDAESVFTSSGGALSAESAGGATLTGREAAAGGDPAAGGTSLARPEFTLFDRQAALLTAQRRALDATLLPRLSLFAQGFYGYPGYNMYDDMFSHDWSLNGMVGIRLNWNVSSLYTRRGEIQKLRLRQDDIENARDVFTFNNDLQQSQERQYAQRCQKLLTQDDQIIQLRQSVREATEAKLQDGIIDVNALLQDITREQQARITRTQHLIEYHQHLAELRFLTNQ